MKSASFIAIALVTITACGAPSTSVVTAPVIATQTRDAAPPVDHPHKDAPRFGMIGLLNGGDGGSYSDAIGESFGAGGLGLSGTDSMGGRGNMWGESVTLGTIGTRSVAAFTSSVVHAPLRVSGRLPPEVIRRMILQNNMRFQFCYESKRSKPDERGHVSVKFIIDRSGSVSTSTDNGSDLPDPVVAQCIVHQFENLSFPQPDGGAVTVIDTMMLEPAAKK